ncbi:SCO4225 family membrane protein [Streptomyces sp. NPDC014995]|uniref:SCO4225 family membrane protein n=1 Tax=Streptomyces sp. NPDC014995 TaxID=3364936 RepID=UPI0036FB1624
MNARRLPGPARLAFANPASLVYLALVATATAFLAWDQLFVTHEDASFAGVYLLVLASPTFFLLDGAGRALLGSGADAPGWFVLTALVLSVLVQSALIGALHRRLRRSPGGEHGKRLQGA